MVQQALIILLLLFWSSSAAAEECTPQDYASLTPPRFDCPGPMELELGSDLSPPDAIPVTSGQSIRAPWDGALVHRDRLLELGLMIQLLRRLRWNDLTRLRAELEAEQRYDAEVAEARLSFAETRLTSYREQLEEVEVRAAAAVTAARSEVARASAWYRSWAFGLVVGFLTAALLVGLAAYVFTVI